jgi:dolichyl-diphosphooligosaccharide--protein glycosyltransferase
MVLKKAGSWTFVVLLLIAIIALALWLRVALPYNQVFVRDWVKMTGVDAYYYMRLVDNLMRHFPQLTQFDPYLLYPGGWTIGAQPDFFAYFMGGIIWLFSLGNADQHTVDVISVFIPPALAVLTILAVFFTGTLLGSKWLGLISAGLLAVMPGEFLNRSLLGYTDHHIAEVLFSTCVMLFAFLAIRAFGGKAWSEMVKSGWSGIGKATTFSMVAGIFMGLYILTWSGALLFALIIFIYIVVQAVVDHVHGWSLDYLGIFGGCLFAVGLIMYMPLMRSKVTVAALTAALLACILMPILSRWMNSRRFKPLYYPFVIGGLFMLGVVMVAIISPIMLQAMVDSLASIFIWPVGTTVMEMQPLLIQQGNFTFAIALGNYMLAFFLSVVCIGVLFYQVAIKVQRDRTLLLIWSIIILLSALSMRRFAYYFAVNVALLTGYLCWIPLKALIKKKNESDTAVAARRHSAKAKKRAIRQLQQSRKTSIEGKFAIAAVLIAIILLAFYPCIGPLPDGQRPSIDLARRPLFAPSNAWCEVVDWLRANSPEPFGKADTYYGLYKPAGQPGGFEYKSNSYGTLAWWDYGYWIARIGRRPPATNPGTGALESAYFFTAQNAATAEKTVDKYGARYIIVDNEIAGHDGKFHALATLSGSDYSHYYDVFLVKQNSQYVPVIYFYPEYYRSMVVRLYNFDGKTVIPKMIDVIEYREFTAQNGNIYKEIIDNKEFSSYEAAERFIGENSSRNYIIAGEDPGESQVPLQELDDYKIVYRSNQMSSVGSISQPSIKIFEYRNNSLPPAGD